MKKITGQREFKKLKSQINQIEEIVKNSKGGAFHEHESTVRKKILLLMDMGNEGLKDYQDLLDRYQEVLEYVAKGILESYNKKNDSKFDYYQVVRGDYNSLLNSGIMTVLTKHHIPKMISEEFEKNFPDNPKNEYREARGIERKFIIHLGDTNTGKTYNAVERLKECKNGVYLSPLRILALENYERLNREGILCDLKTGEEEIISVGATHTSCTIEKLDLNKQYEVAVIDEIQMINDSQRGAAWSRAILGIRSREIHVCGAINAKDIIKTILEDCKDPYEIIEYTRSIPLEVEKKEFLQKDIEDGDAIVLFSKKRVLELAQAYSQRGEKASIIYGDLPPDVRRRQYEQFINKKTKILITTDAIGMGVNLPIRRIIFLSIKKFDGEEVRYLTSQEVKQIAGRAGRKGIYDIGYVAALGNNSEFLKEKLSEDDKIITQAVIGPSDAILRIKTLPLIEKLALWSTRKEKLEYYRKMDISDYIIVLDSIKRFKLKEQIQWKLLKVPFDVLSEELMKQFLFYVDEIFVAKLKVISIPIIIGANLEELEIYYQKINMYYSFCKLFNLEFNMQWIYDERAEVSEEINEILVKI
ncbi:helicase-related protein [Clostridium vincentii]|uniref:RNA helicase n=1 Tax=Clostridium vincentii TaxID=52704 RepID=A0A2T0BIY6_9CLOT|nr:helicase-related protein [Clostridium vincentii]PRR83858.1 ski2-like helicase [Clostridium vincentii]